MLARKRKPEGRVGPTPEQLGKAEYIEAETLVETDTGNSERALAWKNTGGTPLDRYKASGSLSERQWQAGDRFRADWYLSGLEAPLTSNLFAIIGSGEPAYLIPTSHRRAAARQRYRHALKALGMRPAKVVVDIVIHERWARQIGEDIGRKREAALAGMVLLQQGLDTLADHYGLDVALDRGAGSS